MTYFMIILKFNKIHLKKYCLLLGFSSAQNGLKHLRLFIEEMRKAPIVIFF